MWSEISDLTTNIVIDTSIFDSEERQHSPSVFQLTSAEGGGQVVDFCYLSNKYFPSPVFRRDLCAQFEVALHNYPSMQEEQKRLVGELTGYRPEQILVGNGASELIHMVAARVGDRWLMPYPSYMEYENVVRDFGKNLTMFELREADDFGVDIERLLGDIKTHSIDTIVFPNPNSPTGQRMTIEDLERLLTETQGLATLVIDESFIEFTEEAREDIPTLRDRLDAWEHLIVIRSLGKDFGVCGLRLGLIATSNQSVLDDIGRFIPIWNISPMAEVFLRLAIDRIDEYEAARVTCVKETQAFVKALRTVPRLYVYDTYSNFVLFRIDGGPRNSTQLRDSLLQQHGHYVRDCSRKQGLSDRFVRVGTNLPEHNQALVNAIGRLVS